MANPSGFILHINAPADGIASANVDKDFIALTTPEARAVVDVIERTNPAFLINLREDDGAEGMYISYNGKTKSVAYRKLLDGAETDKRPIVNGLKNDDGLIHRDLATTTVNGTKGEWDEKTTLEDWFLKRRKSYITITTPTAWPLIKRIDAQNKTIKRAIEAVNQMNQAAVADDQ